MPLGYLAHFNLELEGLAGRTSKTKGLRSELVDVTDRFANPVDLGKPYVSKGKIVFFKSHSASQGVYHYH